MPTETLFLHVPGPTPAQPQCRIAVSWWGQREDVQQLVVCVHGLTRQRLDFAALAQLLVQRTGVAVASVDVVGRGDSDWLSDPMLYSLPVCVPQLAAVLQQLTLRAQPEVVDWVGTSMGGLIGLGVAAVWPGLRRMVLNDVGPRIHHPGLSRISTYVGQQMEFADAAAAIAHLNTLSQGFGPLTPAQCWALHSPMLRPLAHGRVRLHYDPQIAAPFAAVNEALQQQGEAMLWHLWDTLPAQALILRGAHSDLFTAETAEEMRARQPKTQYVTVPDCGHAPSLQVQSQLEVVARFLWER